MSRDIDLSPELLNSRFQRLFLFLPGYQPTSGAAEQTSQINIWRKNIYA
jgi:hypothetical protein